MGNLYLYFFLHYIIACHVIENLQIIIIIIIIIIINDDDDDNNNNNIKLRQNSVFRYFLCTLA